MSCPKAISTRRYPRVCLLRDPKSSVRRSPPRLDGHKVRNWVRVDARLKGFVTILGLRGRFLASLWSQRAELGTCRCPVERVCDHIGTARWVFSGVVVTKYGIGYASMPNSAPCDHPGCRSRRPRPPVQRDSQPLRQGRHKAGHHRQDIGAANKEVGLVDGSHGRPAHLVGKRRGERETNGADAQ